MVKSTICMFLAGLMVVAVTLAFTPARPAGNDDPPCTTTLTLPQTALELRLDFRQFGPDLSRFQQPEGVDEIGLHQLQVLSHLAQGMVLKSGVSLRAGGHVFKPASYRMGFTVTLGGALRFFLVDGTEAVPVPSTELKPGWSTERLAMHLEYVSRTAVRLVWHLGEKAGALELGLGGSDPGPDAGPTSEDGNTPPPAEPRSDPRPDQGTDQGADKPKKDAPGADQPKNGAPRGG